MIFKVYYQEHLERNPKREFTQSLYLEAENMAEARALIEANTHYNVELIEELSDAAVTYEKSSETFAITTF
ncbi:MAG TPA: DNA-directed RNA polymerase subunit epsilon [Lactobacillaceae bacterium]